MAAPVALNKHPHPDGQSKSPPPASHAPAHSADIQTALALLRAILDIIPSVTPLRPAYPAITSPLSGDLVDAGGLLVTVDSNRPDLQHFVTVYDGSGATVVNPGQLVTFSAGNTGSATVLIPAASSTGITPPTDFLLECAPSGGGNSHRILVTRRGTTPPPVLAVAIAADAPPPFAVGQVVTFTATVTGGTAPYNFVWVFEPGSFGTTNPASHTFNNAGTFTVTLNVWDSTVPAPLSKTVTFGPFQVAVAV
jgi:PKD domain